MPEFSVIDLKDAPPPKGKVIKVTKGGGVVVAKPSQEEYS